jgi:NTP pyrophosphatase (non-canonical NTP hydrolase)
MKNKDNTFKAVYDEQVAYQNEIVQRSIYTGFENNVGNIPGDYPKLFTYHIQHLMSEIGEVLASDKRWKTFRNAKYNRDSKKQEIADCFIVLMNIAIFSGISAEELEEAICNKIKNNYRRIQNL